jgi:DNA-binding LytR/AlgR family response regulator
MRALIAEDEPLLAQDLARRLARLWPELDIAAIVHDGLAARDALARWNPDIAFLDIRMPGLSGLDVAQHAAAACRVVFVTAYDEHAVAAFDAAAADYLLKPVADARLEKCIARLRTPAAEPDSDLLQRLRALLPSAPAQALRWLRVQSGQNLRLLAVEEVCYFQAGDKYTSAVTRDGEHLLRTPLKELLPQLDPEQFWQVHRGTLVNVSQIAAAQRDLLGRLTLTLRHRPETLSVSRAYTHLFKQM